MKKYLISFLVLAGLGASKMFLWDRLWNNKAWWMEFNQWYYYGIIAATVVYAVIFFWPLIKKLFQRKG
jgi:hypothetical protein